LLRLNFNNAQLGYLKTGGLEVVPNLAHDEDNMIKKTF
jgi:hypothetical protein